MGDEIRRGGMEDKDGHEKVREQKKEKKKKRKEKDVRAIEHNNTNDGEDGDEFDLNQFLQDRLLGMRGSTCGN